jgi:hypothetical protein
MRKSAKIFMMTKANGVMTVYKFRIFKELMKDIYDFIIIISFKFN